MASSPNSDSAFPHDDGRKRVAKACDRCRLKKIKCDGKIPCSRCQSENAICQFGERKKSIERRIPPGYVEYLEDQQKTLVKALKKTWQQYAPHGHQLRGVSDPPIHTIMEDLGLLSDLPRHHSNRNAPFQFDEDLETARKRFEDADCVAVVQPRSTSPCSMDHEDSPMSGQFDESCWTDLKAEDSPGMFSMPLYAPQEYAPRQPQGRFASRTQTPFQSQIPPTPPEMGIGYGGINPALVDNGQTFMADSFGLAGGQQWEFDDGYVQDWPRSQYEMHAMA